MTFLKFFIPTLLLGSLLACSPQIRFTNSGSSSKADLGDKKNSYTISGQTFDILNLKNGISTDYKIVDAGVLTYSQEADHGHGDHTHTGKVADLGVAYTFEKGKLYTIDIRVPTNSSGWKITSPAPALAP